MAGKFVQRSNLLRAATLMLLLSLLLSACGGAATTPTTGASTAPAAASEPAAASAEPAAASPDTAASASAEASAEASTAAEASASPEASEEAAASAAPVTTGRTSNYDSASQKITFWFMPNGTAPLEFIQAEAEAFVKDNPDIGIDYQVVDWGNAYTQIQTALQGGSDACVTQLGTTWVPGFSATGGLRPFTAEEIAAVGGESAFVPASWELTGIQGGDEVTALPWFTDVRGIAYRKDILEKAGLDPAEAFKDLDSFVATLQKIKETSPEIAPFVHPGRNDWNVWQNTSQFIWNYGGDILNQEGKQATFNSPEAIKGVQLFASLYGQGLTAPDTLELNSAQTEARFGDGQAATIIAPSYLIGQAKAPKDAGGWQSDEARNNVGFAEFPAGPGGQYTFVGGSQLAIFNDCAAPEAAVKWVEYLTSEESQARYGDKLGMLPALKTAQAAPAFSDPLYDAFKAGATKGKSAPAVVEWGGVENTFQTELQAVWEDVAASPGTPIDEAKIKTRLDGAAETVDGLLGN
jgi:multiple sugar transport system substrate-binding protein